MNKKEGTRWAVWSGSGGQTFCLLFRRCGDTVYDDGEKKNNTTCGRRIRQQGSDLLFTV